MKRNFIIAAAMSAMLLITSCEKENSSSRSSFQPMSYAYANGIGTDSLPDYMDARTHAYEFTALVNGTIENLYYQNMAGSGTYDFSIWEKTGPASAVMLASNSHTFTGIGLETITLSPVTINAGSSYVVVRTYTDASWTVANTIGKFIGLSTATVDSKVTFNYGYFTDAPVGGLTPGDSAFYDNAWDYSLPGLIKVPAIDFELQ